MSGEHRFRHGYSRSNPRKMTQTWAEKEMRNLKRLEAAGIPCPRAILLKLQVLVLDFIGDDEGWPAPRLKVFPGIGELKERLYRQCVEYMHRMFHECHLVHADLSEYNMLVHDANLIIIDVSQSVEHDHPHAADFLKVDCMNVLKFFSNAGVKTLSLKQLFDFVTVSKPLDQLHAIFDAIIPEGYEEDKIFKDSFVPKTLDDIADYEHCNVEENEHLLAAHREADVASSCGETSSGSSDDECDQTKSGSSDEESDTSPKDPIDEKAKRKENKKQVKAENRIRRLNKMKKHEKKRAEKLTKGKKQ